MVGIHSREAISREAINANDSRSPTLPLKGGDMIAEIALKIRQSLDLGTIWQTTVDAVQQLLGCDRALLYQFAAAKSGQVVVEAVQDPQWSILDRTVHDACFEADWLKPYDERQARAIADVATANLSTCYAEFLAGFQVKANLVVPVLCESELWGLLIAHHCSAPRDWLPEEIVTLQQLAIQVGMAIQQASLVAQLQAAKADLEAQVETALRQSRDERSQLAAIVESSQDAIISKTPEGIITSWNRAAERLFGYSAAEAIGQPITLIIPPECQADEALIWQQLHQGQSIENYETQRQCKDGRRVEVALTVSPVQDESGVLIGASKIARDITAQRALQEKTAILHSFYNSLPLMMGVVELSDHDILHISDTYPTATFFNMTEEALEGQWASDLGVPPDHIQTWMQHYHQSQTSGQPVQFDYAHTTDTTTAWLSVVVSYIGLGNSQRPRFSYVATDISDRKQAEADLRASETRWQFALEGSSYGVWDWNAQTNTVFFSRQWKAMLGYGEDEIGNSLDEWSSRVHPDDLEQCYADLQRHFSGETLVYQHEHRMRCKDGSYKWILDRGKVIEWIEPGVPLRMIGTDSDISDRKQAEANLRASEARWQFALEGAGDGVWDWNPQINTVFYSHQWKAILGYDNDEVSHSFEDWSDRVHPEDLGACSADLQRYLSGETLIYQSEYRMRCKDGSYKWIFARGKVIEWAETGEPWRMIGTISDISDRKQIELDLKQAKEQLGLVLQASSEGFSDWNLLTDEIYFSPQFKLMLGYAEHEFENSLDMWNSVIFEEDGEESWRLVDDYNNGTVDHFSITQRYRHRNGSTVYVLTNVIHLKDAAGQVVRMVGSHLDITAISTMQEALQTSEMQLSSVLNSSLDGIMAFRSVRDDADTIVDFEWLLSNPTACDLMGRTEASLIGKRLLEEMPSAREEGLFEGYVHTVETGEPYQREFHYNHDGIESWFENIAVKLGDGFAVTLRNVTTLKQSEQVLHQLNQQLEDRVSDLDQRHAEMVTLSEISDFLQACATVEEACHTITNLVETLFPDCAGGIFITRPSGNRLELVSSWGRQPCSNTDFEPHRCWGLRRGLMHYVGQDRLSLRCHHIPANEATATLCMPMMAQGVTLGLLFLSTETPGGLPEPKQHLARTLAEQVGMAIANLKLQETLQHQSIRDPLTELYNRRYLEETFTQEIVRAERKQHAIGVIMLDIDHFKRFNDTFGHDAGDFVLQQVGTLLKENVRNSDIACRYGGEEMTLILREATLAETTARAEMLRAALSQLCPHHHGQSLGTITASFGVAAFPHHGSTVETLIKTADEALYRAKAAGRNQVFTAA